MAVLRLKLEHRTCPSLGFALPPKQVIVVVVVMTLWMRTALPLSSTLQRIEMMRENSTRRNRSYVERSTFPSKPMNSVFVVVVTVGISVFPGWTVLLDDDDTGEAMSCLLLASAIDVSVYACAPRAARARYTSLFFLSFVSTLSSERRRCNLSVINSRIQR